jgi:hypothetical protein
MAVTHDPRPPYREEPRDAYLPPSRNMLDTASAFWLVVVAALAAVALTWLFVGVGIRVTESVGPNAKPTVETQPVTPPAPAPATRPAPTP